MNLFTQILRLPVRKTLTTTALAAGALIITSCDDSYSVGSSHGAPYGYRTPAAARVYSNSNYTSRYQYSDRSRSQSYNPGWNRDNHSSGYRGNNNWNQHDGRGRDHDRNSSNRWDRDDRQGSTYYNSGGSNNRWSSDNSRYSNGTSWSGNRSYGERSGTRSWDSR